LLNKRIRPIQQADVGWDTLNWKSGTRPYELIGIGKGIHAKFPEIEVNWQAKLVPITANRWRQVTKSSEVGPRFQTLLQKLLPALPASLRTH
jgi:hypothetical protein